MYSPWGLHSSMMVKNSSFIFLIASDFRDTDVDKNPTFKYKYETHKMYENRLHYLFVLLASFFSCFVQICRAYREKENEGKVRWKWWERGRRNERQREVRARLQGNASSPAGERCTSAKLEASERRVHAVEPSRSSFFPERGGSPAKGSIPVHTHTHTHTHDMHALLASRLTEGTLLSSLPRWKNAMMRMTASHVLSFSFFLPSVTQEICDPRRSVLSLPFFPPSSFLSAT